MGTEPFCLPARERRMKFAPRVLEMVVLAAIVYWVKCYYSNANAEDLRWLLGAVAQTTTLLSGTEFTWEPGIGYSSRAHLLVIAPACAGVNFFISAWLTLVLTTAGPTRGWWRWLLAASCIVPAMVATVIINAHRVYFLLSGPADHRAVGVTCFCVGLLALACISHGITRRTLPSHGTLTACVGLYLLVALGLPALNGAGAEPLFFEHAVAVFKRGLLILTISVAGFAALKRASRLRCTLRAAAHGGTPKTSRGVALPLTSAQHSVTSSP